MHKMTIFSILAFSLLALGCKKDKSTDDNGSLATGRCRVSCTVSGDASLNFKSDDGFSFSAYNSVFMGLEPLYKVDATGYRERATILVPVGTVPGTYSLNALGAPNIIFTFTKDNIYSGIGKTWNAGIGSNFTFVLTKSSYTELEGTFSGTATNTSDGSTITVTNGKLYTAFSH